MRKNFLALAKELNISNEVAIQLGEAFYHLNPNSKRYHFKERGFLQNNLWKGLVVIKNVFY